MPAAPRMDEGAAEASQPAQLRHQAIRGGEGHLANGRHSTSHPSSRRRVEHTHRVTGWASTSNPWARSRRQATTRAVPPPRFPGHRWMRAEVDRSLLSRRPTDHSAVLWHRPPTRRPKALSALDQGRSPNISAEFNRGCASLPPQHASARAAQNTCPAAVQPSRAHGAAVNARRSLPHGPGPRPAITSVRPGNRNKLTLRRRGDQPTRCPPQPSSADMAKCHAPTSRPTGRSKLIEPPADLRPTPPPERDRAVHKTRPKRLTKRPSSARFSGHPRHGPATSARSSDASASVQAPFGHRTLSVRMPRPLRDGTGFRSPRRLRPSRQDR